MGILGGRNTWLDPYNRHNHDLIVQLAMEAEALGVDEIQLDYIRFPWMKRPLLLCFPLRSKRPDAMYY